MKATSHVFLSFIKESPKNHIEFYVDGLGWLILLKENIEIVSDNWFTSTKYSESKYAVHPDNEQIIVLENIYRLNPPFVENENNVKYNLHYNQLHINADKIVAFH
ncbi:hypothetical protein ACR6HW_17865 [Fusibacter sp. JL298sf-3]